MITIRVNGKKQKIPTFRELSTGKYIELMKRIRSEDYTKAPSDLKFLLHYLDITLPDDFKFFLNSRIKKHEVIIESLGDFLDYSKERKTTITYDGKEKDFRDYDLLLWQRITIEESGHNLTDESLMLFMAAVGISEENNISKIRKIEAELLTMPYMEVLPGAFFLLRKFMSGRKKESRFSKVFPDLIKILRLKNRPV